MLWYRVGSIPSTALINVCWFCWCLSFDLRRFLHLNVVYLNYSRCFQQSSTFPTIHNFPQPPPITAAVSLMNRSEDNIPFFILKVQKSSLSYTKFPTQSRIWCDFGVYSSRRSGSTQQLYPQCCLRTFQYFGCLAVLMRRLILLS